MKNNHTPGPWKHDEKWGLIKYGKTEICALHSGNKANANLIASAPELLAALKSIKEWLEEPIDYQNLPQQIAWANGVAKAAIAKAKGESK